MHRTIWIGVATATALLLGLLGAATAGAATPARYVLSAQNADGGFGITPSATSSDLATGWATLGLAAGGRDPRRVRRGGRSPVGYLRARIGGVRAIGEIERTALAVRAAGLNPRRFGGRNLIREIARYRGRGGSVAGQVSYTSFGVLALRAGGVRRSARRVRRALRWLARQQNRDGGFSVGGRGGVSGIDDTASAIQALAAGGRRGRRTRRAARFIARAQNPDGGFPLQRGGESNAQSTAYAVQALVAARRHRRARRRGLRHLRSLTEPSGRVRYSRTRALSPVWVTSQAMMALARQPLPVPPPR